MPTRSLGMLEFPCLNPLSAGVGMPPTILAIMPQMAKMLHTVYQNERLSSRKELSAWRRRVLGRPGYYCRNISFFVDKTAYLSSYKQFVIRILGAMPSSAQP